MLEEAGDSNISNFMQGFLVSIVLSEPHKIYVH